MKLFRLKHLLHALCAGIVIASIGVAQAQNSPYQIGDKVELHASGDHWQKCVVTDPGDTYRVVRLQCEPYAGAGYSRHGGTFVESTTSTGLRRLSTATARPTVVRPPAAIDTPAVTPASPVAGGGYQVGQKVEIEASQHWVPCTVSDIQNYGHGPLIRVQCSAYPALSRAAGIYIVHNNESGIRPATGRTGPAPAPPTPVRAQPGPGTSLRAGEYACYGVRNQILAGLKFNVTGPGRYTDAYGQTGSFSISTGSVRFSGGALGGMTGRDLKTDNSFTLGTGAVCQLWG